MKISVIGAGSSYTPELIEGIIEHGDELPLSSISLMDIDLRKLNIVGGLARRMLEAAGLEIPVEITPDLTAAVDGTSFVINQIRAGGLEGRILDEKIPLKYGIIGQETTGPGGFSKALRTIPIALQIARKIEAQAPNAFLINFTNPAGLITEALLRHSPVQTIGLCNLPIGARMHIAEQLGVEAEKLQLDWVGLNHLNWIRGASMDGQDRWQEVFAAALEEAREAGGDGWNFPPDLLESLGMIPCGYLNYYYYHAQMLAAQQAAPRTRGEQVRELESQLMALYQDPNLNAKPAQLGERGGAYYSKAAVSLISSIVNDKNKLHIVNTVNGGAIPDLPPDVVVEVPCLVNRSGAYPQQAAPLPGAVKGLVQAVKAYQALTVEAGAAGDRRLALQALLAHPLVLSFDAARGLLDELLAAHRDHLPQFFPEGQP